MFIIIITIARGTRGDLTHRGFDLRLVRRLLPAQGPLGRFFPIPRRLKLLLYMYNATKARSNSIRWFQIRDDIDGKRLRWGLSSGS